MQLTTDALSKITGRPVNANMRSIVVALDAFGRSQGLDKPHRLAHYIAQLAHESGSFRYDKEIWGPTAAQKRYDTRTDLGNTAAADGDGKLYAGRGPIQITGKSNYRQFTEWCRKQGMNNPDFVAQPDMVTTDPWEGLVPIWYWSTRNLNKQADANDIEQITKKINGGLNGFADRIEWYVKTALVLAGYGPDSVKSFQIDAQRAGLLPPGEDQVDGDAGPKTRAALHMTLAKSAPASVAVAVKASPVTEETEVVVAPQGADKTMMSRVSAGVAVVAPAAGYLVDFDQTGKLIMLGIGIVAVVVMLWKGELIAARVRSVLNSFDGETK